MALCQAGHCQETEIGRCFSRSGHQFLPKTIRLQIGFILFASFLSICLSDAVIRENDGYVSRSSKSRGAISIRKSSNHTVKSETTRIISGEIFSDGKLLHNSLIKSRNSHFTQSSSPAVPESESKLYSVFAKRSKSKRSYADSTILSDSTNGFKFTKEIYETTIIEHSRPGTYVTTDELMGIFLSPSAAVSSQSHTIGFVFHIIAGDDDQTFKVESRKVGDFVFLRVRTRTTSALNRESKSSYKLTVVARRRTSGKSQEVVQKSLSRNGRSVRSERQIVESYEATTVVLVRVLDSNDLGPLFDQNEYSATLSDQAPIHHVVTQVVASDSDEGRNSEIYYQLLGDHNSTFAIHPNSGAIILLRSAEKLVSDYYKIEVLARDRGHGGNSRVDRATVDIYIKQENRFAPVVRVLSQRSEIFEGSTARVALAILRVSDEDKGKNGIIASVVVLEDNEKVFELQPVNYEAGAKVETIEDNSRSKFQDFVLLSQKPIWRKERSDVVRIVIEVRDDGSPSKSGFIALSFSLLDNIFFPNQRQPKPSIPSSSFLRAEKCFPVGSTVGSVGVGNSSRSECDLKIQLAPVRCSNLNSTISEKNCSVGKEDGLNKQCHCSIFLKNFHQSFEALTRNSEDSLDLRYYTDLNPFDYVKVHPWTGVVSITESLRSLPAVLDGLLLMVHTTSCGRSSSRVTALKHMVFIRLTNCNDNPPVFRDFPSNPVVLSKDILQRSKIFRVKAVDGDLGNGNDVIYSIYDTNSCSNIDSTANSESELFQLSNERRNNNDRAWLTKPAFSPYSNTILPFAVNRSTGEVFTTSLFDFDFGPRCFELVIRASDAGRPYPRWVDTPPIRVEISDVKERPPYFSHSNLICSVPKKTNVGALISIIHAEDTEKAGGPITFSSVNSEGNDTDDRKSEENETCFFLDEHSGHLTLTCDLTESQNNFFLEVQAFDGLHNSTNILMVEIRVIDSGEEEKLDETISSNFSEIFCKKSKKLSKTWQPQTSLEKSRSPVVVPRRTHPANRPPRLLPNNPTVFHIKENSPLGFVFGEIKAFDPDAGYNGLLQFAVVKKDSDTNGGADGSRQAHLKAEDLFDVDVYSGRLKTVVPLDREHLRDQQEQKSSDENHRHRRGKRRRAEGTTNEMSANYFIQNISDASQPISYSLIIRVCDMADIPLCTDTSVEVVVDDENDNPPKFEVPYYRIIVKENVPLNTTLIKVVAFDEDESENGRIVYSIVGSDRFSVHPVSGEVVVSRDLDREVKDVHEFKIVAEDSSKESSLASEVPFIVVVGDVNDNVPMFLRQLFVFQILEDLPLNSSVGFVQAIDPDEGENGEVVYFFTSDGGSHPFWIDPISGAIILRGGPLIARHMYQLVVSAKDKGRPPLVSSRVQVHIRVVPVNRNHHAPLFDDFVKECSVRENQPVGSSVVQLLATDLDHLDPLSPPENYRVEYSIKSGSGLGGFIMDERGIVRTAISLDREGASSYWLTVYAHDSGSSPLGSSIHLFIRVLDENDNLPVFKQPIYRVVVAENSPPRKWVGQLEATDADEPSKEGLTFHLKSESNLFSIDRKSGIIRTTASEFDRESVNEYRLEVTVTDNGEEVSLTSTALVVITVTDANDNSPKFFDAPHLELFLPIFNEHHHHHHHREDDLYKGLLAIQAYDVDEGSNSEIEYSLEVLSADDEAEDAYSEVPFPSSASSLFQIDSKTGSLSVHKSLAEGDLYSLQVTARDRGQPSQASAIKVAVAGVKVEIDDQRSLRFIDDSCALVHVLESETAGHVMCIVVAQILGNGRAKEQWEGTGATVWYFISGGNDGSHFGIDWRVGSLRLLKKLDKEARDRYNLTIRATDGSTVVTMQSVIVVLDVNEDDPRFESSSYHFNLTIDSANNTKGSSLEVGQVKATDRDGKIVYDLKSAVQASSYDLFAVDSESGILFINDDPTSDLVPGCHVIIVEAKNRPLAGQPVRRDCAYVTICLKTSYINASCNMSNRSERNRDDDTCIASSNRPPFFMQTYYYAKVGWMNQVGDAIVRVEADDPDYGEERQISYEILSDNNGLFAIDPLSGIIRLTSLVHFYNQSILTKHGITMTIQAKDSGTPQMSDTCSVQVDLSEFLDSRDLQLELHDLDPSCLEVVENLKPGSYVAHFLTNHLGFGLNYSLECYDDHDSGIGDRARTSNILGECSFAINSASGVLTTLKSLDREEAERYHLVVAASFLSPRSSSSSSLSSAASSLSAASSSAYRDSLDVYIVVKDQNDNRPQFHASVFHGQIPETLAPGGYVLSTNQKKGKQTIEPLVLKARDKDDGLNAVIRFAIVDDWARKLFEISESSGLVRTKAVLDREMILMFQEMFHVSYFDRDELTEMEKTTFPNGSNASLNDSHLPSIYSKMNVSRWPSYALLKFKVKAYDLGSPSLTSYAQVVVAVQDVNDVPPEFELDVYHVTLRAPLVRGFKVARVRAVDLDFVVSDLKYHLSFDESEDSCKYFDVDESTGWITVSQKFCSDYNDFCLRKDLNRRDRVERLDEKRSAAAVGKITDDLKFLLNVTCTDGKYKTHATVIVRINRDDDDYDLLQNSSSHEMTYHHARFYFENSFHRVNVLENQTDSQFMTWLKVVTFDPEETLTYVLLNYDDLFSISAHSGLLETRFDSPLDREVRDTYLILVEVRSHLIGHMDRCLVEVKVEDVNDNAPLFMELPYVVTVDVRSAKGQVVFKPNVIDLDAGINAKLNFSMVRGNSSIFSIEPSSGWIILGCDDTSLLLGQKFIISIVAEDAGHPTLSGTAEIILFFKNHAHPYFDPPHVKIPITSDADLFSSITTFSAESPSASKLVYTIQNDEGFDHGCSIRDGKVEESIDWNRILDVDFQTGSLVLLHELSLDLVGKSHCMIVRATDVKTGYSGKLEVTIVVVEGIRAAPLFDRLVYRATVTRFDPVGHVIVRPKIVNRNTSDRNIRFKIASSGNQSVDADEMTLGGHFEVDSETGAIRIGKILDFERMCFFGKLNFILGASDLSDPAMSSSSVVVVSVSNDDDLGVRFTSELYETVLEIPSVAAFNLSDKNERVKSSFKNRKILLVKVTAAVAARCDCVVTSSDGVTASSELSYSIVHSSQVDFVVDQSRRLHFSMDRRNGSIYATVIYKSGNHPGTVASLPKYVELNVSAFCDRGVMNFTTVRVMFHSENLFAPHFEAAIYSFAVDASTPVGGYVGSIAATDVDVDGAGYYLKYEVQSDDNNDGKYFMIDSKGRITIIGKLDEISDRALEFYVRATDEGGLYGEAKVKVKVSGGPRSVEVPMLERREYKIQARTNTSVGSEVLKLVLAKKNNMSSEDDDDDAGMVSHNKEETIVFTVTPEWCLSKDGVEYFLLNSETGSLIVSADLKLIENSSLNCFIKASSSKSSHIFSITPLTLYSTANEIMNAEFTQSQSFDSIPPVVPNQPMLTDYSSRDQNSLEFFDPKILKFEMDYYAFRIAENLRQGAWVGKVLVDGMFHFKKGRIRYALKERSDANRSKKVEDYFFINENLGDITTKKSLDYEAIRFFEFFVVIVDGHLEYESSQVEVHVDVIDRNDQTPQFLISSSVGEVDKAFISEDAAVGKVVMKITTVDMDTHQDTILNIRSGDPCGRFGFSPTSGELILKRPVNREVESHYELVIAAFDGMHSSETVVHIDVLDVNDNPPVCSEFPYEISVPENVAIGTEILTISSSDPDLMNSANSNVTYQIDSSSSYDNDAAEFFSIDEQLGHIAVKSNLDREVQSEHKFWVRSVDGHGLFCRSHVKVRVEDANDNPPRFLRSHFEGRVEENAAVGVMVMKVTAFDLDLGENGIFFYSIEDQNSSSSSSSSSSSCCFEIDSQTGVITALKTFDREFKNQYNLTVFAHSSLSSSSSSSPAPPSSILPLSSPPLTYSTATSPDSTPPSYSWATVTISITDVNDNPPIFTRLVYELSVPEDAGLDSTLGTVKAISIDEGLNALVTYSLVNYTPGDSNDASSNVSDSYGNYVGSASEDEATGFGTIANQQIFHIDSNTGQLTLKAPLDYESTKQYRLHVVATDSGTPRLSSVSVVIVTVEDVNDNAPVFLDEWYECRALENTTFGTSLIQVSAIDKDSGSRGTVRYKLVSGNVHETFKVDEVTGLVTLERSLDRETISFYEIELEARDLGIPALSTFVTIRVTVDDVNDCPPRFGRSQYEAFVPDNVKPNRTLLFLDVYDGDDAINGRPFEYEIIYVILRDKKTIKQQHNSTIETLSHSDKEDTSTSDEDTSTLQEYSSTLPMPKSSSINAFKISCTGELVSSDSTSDYLDGIGFYSRRNENEKNDGDDDKFVEILVKVSDGGVPSLSSYAVVVLAPVPSPMFHGSADGGDEEVIAFFQTQPLRVRLNLIRKNWNGDDDDNDDYEGEEDDDADDDDEDEFSRNGGVVGRVKVVLKIKTSTGENKFPKEDVISDLIETNANRPDDEAQYTAEFSILQMDGSDDDDVSSSRNYHKSGDYTQLFRIDSKTGVISSYSPLDPGVYKFKVEAVLKTPDVVESENGDDSGKENRNLNHHHHHRHSKSHRINKTSTSDVTITVDYVSRNAVSQAVIIRLVDSSLDDKNDEPTPSLSSSSSSSGSSLFRSTFTSLKSCSSKISCTTSGLVGAISVGLGINPFDVKILGINFEKTARLKRSLGLTSSSSSSAPSWVEFSLVAKNSSSNRYLTKDQLKKNLLVLKKNIEDGTNMQLDNIETEMSCDKAGSGSVCKEGSCKKALYTDKRSTISVEVFLYGHNNEKDHPVSLQLPLFSYEFSCLCPGGHFVGMDDICTNSTNQPSSIGKYPAAVINCSEVTRGCSSAGNDGGSDGNRTWTFGGRSYLVWHAGLPLEKRMFLSFELKTNQMSARIMHASGNMDYCFLEIESGFILFRWDFGSGPGVIRVHGQKVNNGRWHQVTLERSGLHVRLTLDSVFMSEGVAHGNSDVLNLDNNNIIFGSEVTLMYKIVRHGFIGCLKNIVLNKEELTLTSSTNQGYLIAMENVGRNCNELNFKDACSSNPCHNHGSCIVVGQDDFKCVCLTDFTGDFCDDKLPHTFKPAHLCFSTSSNPCLNSGSCIPIDERQYKCECVRGFVGKNCESVVSTGIVTVETGKGCRCQNGGSCFDEDKIEKCKCLPKFIGELCQDSVDDNDDESGTSLGVSQLERSKNVIIAVTVIIASLATGLVILLVVCCFVRRKNKKKILNNNNGYDSCVRNSKKIDEKLCSRKQELKSLNPKMNNLFVINANNSHCNDNIQNNQRTNSDVAANKEMKISNNRRVTMSEAAEDYELQPLQKPSNVSVNNYNEIKQTKFEYSSTPDCVDLSHGIELKRFNSRKYPDSGTAAGRSVSSSIIGERNHQLLPASERPHHVSTANSEQTTPNSNVYERTLSDKKILDAKPRTCDSRPRSSSTDHHLGVPDHSKLKMHTSDNFSTKESLSWDSKDLPKNTFDRSYEVVPEDSRSDLESVDPEHENIFNTTTESDRSIQPGRAELDSSFDLESSFELPRTLRDPLHPSFTPYQTTFDISSVDLSVNLLKAEENEKS